MNIGDLIDEHFAGCISIKKNGTILFEKAYGYADLPNQIPNEINTKFASASAGKIFTAVAIMQLIGQELLHLEDTIGGILDFDLKAIDPDITIRQLLTHVSGIPDYFDETVMEDYAELWQDYPNYRIRTSEDLIPLFIDKPMMYPKGEKFQYNNTGFVVLGLVIEKICGQPFDVYLRKHIFDVCEMQDTGYYELDRLPAKCANGYLFDRQKNEYYSNIYSIDVKGSGAGGVYITTGDMERFWGGLLSYRLLPADITEEMLKRQAGSEKEGNYGYGVWLRKSGENAFYPYVQGCDPGVSFISSYQADQNLLITLVSNFGCNVWKMMRGIRNEMESA